MINFHIAYPNLTYWHIIKKWVNKPVVITEHWSAYHFNFGVKKSLPRIKRIFRQGLPVIAISRALVNDLEKFSQTEIDSYVVPNAVDTEIFNRSNNRAKDSFFFMVSQWKEPKRPIVALEAFKLFQNTHPEYKLVIGGYGSQWAEIVKWQALSNLEQSIDLVGSLTSEQIAHYMQKCTAFIHPSGYETFSVVCAEAICCGAPVIAPKVGGIPEVVGKNGILLEEFNDYELALAMDQILKSSYTNDNLSKRFSKENVSKEYTNVITELLTKK